MHDFCGANTFGQFGRENERRTETFKSFDDILLKECQPLVSCCWSYNAYAFGNKVMLRGFLTDRPNGICCVTAAGAVKEIAGCERFCLVLLENGKLYKLLPKMDAELEEILLLESVMPKKRSIFGEVKLPEPIKLTHIAAGQTITMALSSTNALFSIPSQIYQFPKHIRITQLACGFEHGVLLSSNGDVYCWGNGLRGQLGAEQLRIEELPILNEALAGIKITCIAAGGWHSAAISAFGDLYTWGFNSNGQLGLRLFKSNGLKEASVYPLPQLLDLPMCCKQENSLELESCKCSPIQVFAGARHTILQMDCGALLAVGWNRHGQLGLVFKNKDYCDTFTKTDFKVVPSKRLNIVCGSWCTILLRS